MALATARAMWVKAEMVNNISSERLWHFHMDNYRAVIIFAHLLIVRDGDRQDRDRWVISSHQNKTMSRGRQVTNGNQAMNNTAHEVWHKHRSLRWKYMKKQLCTPSELSRPSEVGATAEFMQNPHSWLTPGWNLSVRMLDIYEQEVDVAIPGHK